VETFSQVTFCKYLWYTNEIQKDSTLFPLLIVTPTVNGLVGELLFHKRRTSFAFDRAFIQSLFLECIIIFYFYADATNIGWVHWDAFGVV
jgi:hypothetical protein